MNRQTGGVVLAFAGFVFIVGAFKGTWRNTIDALMGKTPASAAPPSSSSKAATSTSGSGLPGGAPPTNPLASGAR